MKRQHKKYIKFVGVMVTSILGSIYIINLSIDPLWYFGGNKIFPKNYSFNERVSKVNEYLKSAKNYDCILFGSSRVTLLNASKITGYKCFNFSFSDGNPEEFIAFSKYINEFGGKPKLIILGIDARFYSRLNHGVSIPDFVKKLEYPPSNVKTYLSYKALEFSLKTIFRLPPQPRYYNELLIGAILPGTQDYAPPECFTLEGYGLAYTDINFHFIDSLKRILNPKLFIGYIAPVSAWDMLPLLEDGQLPSYLKTMYELSKKFDRFYDFSIPSKLTSRTDNNYDGHHFSPESNNQIVTIINGASLRYGVDLMNLSGTEYQRQFTDAITNFALRTQNRKKSSWNCDHRTAMR